MVLFKKVNGVQVQLSEEEETAIVAEWNANAESKEQFELEFGHLQKRRAEYPPTEEQLEGICEGLIAIRDGNRFPQITLDLLSSIEEINARYPQGVG